MKVDKRSPNLFLVGAPKCGTTSLSSYLADHPDIFMSEEAPGHISRNGVPYLKEPGFYAADHSDLFSQRRVFDKDEYLNIFTYAKPGVTWLGEATVNYLSSKMAVPEIINDTPDARFVVCIRNPVDLAQSLHSHRVKSGTENILEFEEAWYAQNERLKGQKLPPGSEKRPEAYQYSEMAKIGSQLSRLLTHVAREKVHIVIMDDMKRDPVAAYKELLAFLGLRYDGRVSFPRSNESKKERSKMIARALIWMKAIRRRSHLPSLGLGVLSSLNAKNLVEGRKEIDAPLEAEMQRYYTDEVNLLSEITGRDLAGWLNN